MLYQVTGKISGVLEQSVVVEAGGVGFLISVPNPVLFKVGTTETVLVYMHWNAENGPQLFGFRTPVEKRVFLQIISCSGVGPKIGLAILGHMTPTQFLRAAASHDVDALSAVNGIGPKKAEQIIVQLKQKATDLLAQSSEESEPSSHMHEVMQALTALNYSRPEISRALHHVNNEYAGKNASFDQLLRAALSVLATTGHRA